MAAGAAVAFAASKFTPSPVHAGQEGFKAICVLHPDGKGNEQINGIVRFSQEKGTLSPCRTWHVADASKVESEWRQKSTACLRESMASTFISWEI